MQYIKPITTLLIFIGIFGLIYWFSTSKVDIKQDSYLNTQINNVEDTIQLLDNELRNFKVEDLSLENEIDYWRRN